MTWDYLRSRLPADWPGLLTAYFFSLIPAAALIAVSLAIAHFLGVGISGPTSGGGPIWLGFILALGALVAVATTRIRRALEGIRRTGERYRVALESAADGILMADKTGKFLEANAAACRMLHYSPDELLGLSLSDLGSPGLAPCAPFAIDEMLAGKPLLRECKLRQRDGFVRPVELNGQMLGDGRVMMILRDISGRKRAEESLRASERRYRFLFEGSLAGVYRATGGGRLLECNHSFAAMVGCRSPDEALGHDAREFFPAPEEFHAFEDKLREHRSLANQELCRRRVDGSRIWVLESACLTTDDRLFGEVIQGTVIDITAYREAKEKIRESLAEKEVLLKEVHHRVKNNLQIISSLLSLQAERVLEPGLTAVFRESQNRIKSIALLHEGLYQSKDLAQIDFGGYLGKLAQQVSSTFGGGDTGIRVQVDADPVTLGLDSAVPCALIVNELVSNAFKHAFPGGDGGEIQVTLEAGQAGETAIAVADTGVGLPADVRDRSACSLGLRLLDTLVSQLKGKLDCTTGPGTRFVVSFTRSGHE